MEKFLRRYLELSQRFCENIKRKRAEISPEIANKYFDNVQALLENIPAQNIINDNETNFSDDPSSQRVIVYIYTYI